MTQDFHTNTAQHDVAFHCFMDLKFGPGWREWSDLEKRKHAKAFNFAKLFRGGIDALRKKADV